jgi:hypothetical protein
VFLIVGGRFTDAAGDERGVLLLVIVFVLVVVRRSPARARSPAHAAEHGDDAHTESFRRCCGLWINQRLKSKEVNDCGTFHSRTSRNGVEASALPLGCVACSLCDVERDGNRRASELVRKFPVTARHLLQDLKGECRELQGALIDVEPLKI